MKSNRRVLVINPPAMPLSHPSILIEPIDALAVATWVRALGHQTSLIDFNRSWPGLQDAAVAIEAQQPDIVVIPFDYHIPLYSSAAALCVKSLISLARSRHSLVVIGGKPASFFPETFLKTAGVVAIKGEMEPALAELLGLETWNTPQLGRVDGIAFFDRGKMVQTTPRQNCQELNQLPCPDRSMLDLSSYIDVRTLLSSRGCVERCSFCPVRCFWGTWRGRRADLVVDEIQYLIQKCGAKKVLFLDDHALAQPARMRAICTEILERGISTSMGCLATPSSFDPGTFALMFKAGFRWVHFGAESGSAAVLERLGKRVTLEQIRGAISGAKALGFRVRSSWILDAPGITTQALDDTLDLIAATRSDEIRLHFLALRAGAPLAAGLSMLPEQFIHAAGPHAGLADLPGGVISAQAARLALSLKSAGYQICGEHTNWETIAAEADAGQAARFISFGASRYGIGWRENAVGGVHA